MEMNLRQLGVPGTIGFNIKAKDTEQNQEVHNAFREYCKEETNDDYTLGIRKLLEGVQANYQFEMLYDKVLELEQRLAVCEAKDTVKEEAVKGSAF